MACSEAKKKQMKEYAKTAVQQMLKWAQKEYKLDEKILDATIIISFDETRKCSYGGWHKNRRGKWRPYINLKMHPCAHFTPRMQTEYPWYKDDPEIGQQWVKTWKAWVRLEASHECSHTLEFMGSFLNDKQKKKLEKKFGRSRPSDDHSENFQKIYREFRRKFVNRIRHDK